MDNKWLCPSLMWTNMIKKIAHHSARSLGSSLMKHSHVSSSSGALLNARTSYPAATTDLICPGFPRVELLTLCTTGTGGTAGFPTPSWGGGTDTWRVWECCKGWQGSHLEEQRCGEVPGNPWGIQGAFDGEMSRASPQQLDGAMFTWPVRSHPNAEPANFK